MLSSLMEDTLLTIAREEIELFFIPSNNKDRIFPYPLQEKGSCFVTLQKNNKLRGCYGTIFPFQSLVDDVRFNAIQAAFHDPRFAPLEQNELPAISIEISLLSSIQPIEAFNEQVVLAALEPHVTGVVLQWKEHKSTFLPLVWSIFPKKEDFLSALKKKAGLNENFWDEDIEVFTYKVRSIKENR